MLSHSFPQDLARQFRMEPDQGRIWLGQQRAFLMQLPAFAAFRRELIAEIGVAHSRRLLARMGYAAGSSDAGLARQLRDDESNHAFMAGPLLHAMEGVTRVETIRMEVDVDSGHHYVEQVWHDSLEASAHLAHLPPSAEPVCWMQVGHASGFNSAFFGRTVLFREIECRGMGHTHCRIIGKPIEEWGADADQLELFGSTDYINASLNEPLQEADQKGPDLIGADPNFLATCRRIEKIAKRDVTVLLQGETGVGKERFARYLHQISHRADKPFVAVNCAALPETLIESELFGVEKGAFTGATRSRPGRFELANGGTLFLDEVGTLTSVAQEKLLRVLQQREVDRLGGGAPRPVDIRVVAATNADLEADVRSGRFREDLFYRINVVPIHLPALRERRSDIPLLIRYFIKRFSSQHQRLIKGLSRTAVRALLEYDFPGNVRELENIIERGVVLADDNEAIGLSDLFLTPPQSRKVEDCLEALPLRQAVIDEWLDTNSLEALIETSVKRAMSRANGNIAGAARLLGVTRRQLEYRLKKHM
ncbi:sigma-54-dependent Fis family transcriptional regulator [Pseudomonas aeruginosa]|uniref:sigma-54-dependent Fis family transcriptional regulator n=1 Tax=Pseudomonas aeruginosa TaxID=287 RepID=UPI000D6FC51C|nr:sigma-54-dependent Fis family transcriptional regulator [Pseudomonas aeruginosa]ELK4918969.1 sigma 54-interacting transcriptional regulator [Pseudomonas aeruginosa]MCP9254304.1 sigma 54-interacting transcriptional regulator [Pseudomonas aeruginosa]MCS8549171.1 sigma 54-interacting transcriptional regulator [Pseudomonas aeruginosa]MCT1239335.1 sigma 54-interacting transcriptional regulator [Pseudomonas aeruginosa]MDA3425348.1 sigma 54-interacting transcriptional regulator [Pseudomonas aerugi